MDPGTALGLVVNVAGLADITFRVFTEIYEYFRAVKSAPTKSLELQHELFALFDIAHNMKNLLSKTSARDGNVIPNELVSQFRRVLEEMEGKIKLPEGNVKQRMKWPFTMKENLEYIARLERFKTTFTCALTVYQRYQVLMLRASD
jgi:hypothetical protein